MERRVRRQPRLVRLRVIALDQRDLLRRLPTQIVPLQLVRGIVVHPVGRAGTVRIHELDRGKVTRIEGAPVGDGERLVGDGVGDGPPDIDDADARLEEASGVVGEMVLDALDGGPIGLVDVDGFLHADSQSVGGLDGEEQ